MARNKSITEIAILSLLSNKPMYGVEMAEEIKRLSGNVVVMPLPTLYSALHKMADKKLVNSYWQEAEVGGRQHVYNITKVGREYYEKNKFEINYQLLKENNDITHKTYSTLEEAFSLPLNNKPIPADKRVLQINQPEPEKVVRKTQTTPYLQSTDKIASTEVQHKQMAINLTGTVGSADLRPLVKLNAIKAENDFVIINKLHLFAGVLNTLLFAFLNFLLSLTHASPEGYYHFIYILLTVYLAITLAVFIVFPKIKSIFTKSKSFKIRGLVTLGLIVLVAVVTIFDKSINLLWLGLFAFVPVIECIFMIILRKWKGFAC